MEQWTTRRIVLLTLTVGTVLYLVYYVPGAIAHFVGRVWDVVVILILATALALLLAPLVEFLCRLKTSLAPRMQRMLATLFVMGALVWVAWVLVSLTATQMFQESSRIAAISKEWLSGAPSDLQAWLDAHAEQLPEGAVENATNAVAQWTQGILQYQFDFARGALLQGWYLVELLIIPVLSFYFLTDPKPLREGFLYLLPAAHRDFAGGVLSDVAVLLNSYVRTQVALCVIKGFMVGLVLHLCGVKMYLTLALIAAISRMAPVVGPLVAGVPCVGIPLLQHGLNTGLVVLFFYWLFIFIDGKLLTPILLAGTATLHPVVVIISLLLGYEFMGILGLFIAVPVAGIVRIAYTRYNETYMNGSDGGPPPEQTKPGPGNPGSDDAGAPESTQSEE